MLINQDLLNQLSELSVPELEQYLTENESKIRPTQLIGKIGVMQHSATDQDAQDKFAALQSKVEAFYKKA